MTELLSPAGNLEKLMTALNYGADACYMGLDRFSLRANADNFTSGDLQEVIKVKKESGKRLYLALNIIFHQRDLDELERMKDELSAWPFDAFIISDIGLVEFLKKNFPSSELRLSTQASCMNKESARMYYEMGFSRVILGREASIDEIKAIKDYVPSLDLECFVHGAMCMAYSGRCMLSKALTGRSANQGDCSHTCRWNYRLNYALEEEERPGMYFPIEEHDGFTTILSSKDLMMFDHLGKLKDAGISSFKIEGRMKSEYYVALVTRAYRKALDNARDKDEYRRDLYDVSHREFTTGFFFPEDDSVSTPTSYGYERSYLYLGKIGRKVEEGLYELDVKNQIRSSSPIEYIAPDVHMIKDDDFKLYDSDMNEVEKVDHGKNSYIKTSLPVKEGYLMRKENTQNINV